MKAIVKTVIAAVLFFSISTTAHAQNRGVEGLIIGSGAGAIMGQAVGRNAEATILGATVGGILGAVIGAEAGGHHTNTVVVHERSHHSHYRPAPKVYYRDHHRSRPVYREPRFQGHHYRKHLPPRTYYSKPCDRRGRSSHR